MKQFYSFVAKNFIVIAAIAFIITGIVYTWHMYAAGQFGQ